MNVSKSQTRTKETITSQWFNENVAFVLGTADARGIPRSKLVLYLDFTRAGADGKIPLLEVMPDSTALSSLKVLGMHGNAPWWNAEQRDNIAMYFEKRKDAFANGFKGLQIVHACRFETSVYAGRWMVVEEVILFLFFISVPGARAPRTPVHTREGREQGGNKGDCLCVWVDCGQGFFFLIVIEVLFENKIIKLMFVLV